MREKKGPKRPRNQEFRRQNSPGSSPGFFSSIFSSISSALTPSWVEGISRGIWFAFGVTNIILTYLCTSYKCPRTAPREVRDQEVSDLNRWCANQALYLILSLKGYYIKAAQTLCGAGQFPPEFDDVFAILLDQCPKEPFETVKEIIESELGCSMDRIFLDFDKEAVAAASIGQVHFARLIDGTKVAVKVQYPEVERFFQVDVSCVSFAMMVLGMGSQVAEVFETMQEQFKQEFDFSKESAVMREVAENVMPHFGSEVVIPLPIDSLHPSLPKCVPNMCTQKVLTMVRLEGVPIRQHVQPMMEMFADMHGMKLDDLKKLMQEKDVTKVDMNNAAVKMALNMGEVSRCQSQLLMLGLQARNVAARVVGGCAEGICKVSPPKWTKRVQPVLDGYRLARLLYDVHGFEIFQNGLFNSDPHAGNILMMPDGKLGLLDYGAVLRLTEEQRTNIAMLLIAIADEDDDAVPHHFWACGFRSKNQDPRLALLLAHVFFNRGPYPYDMNRLSPKVGLPKDADIITLDQYIRGGKIDEIEAFPGHMVMLQRCAMVLSGIGMELGAGRLSSAAMLKPQALLWLEADLAPSLLNF
eukprot:TRINITY_DN5925_c0_g4_i1.p1 TRINITY_DN5925_c0_g4~~TRINITY_DN5925_c0_g4_i1.p1  ORF type:complete len:583 (+),score=97.09 TRINITY_DN5925_c0_g4_i1:81-1829(+)